MAKLPRYFAFLLLTLVGILALMGGGNLIFDPSGASLGIGTDLLNDTLFSDYLIPGLTLFFLLGALSILAAILTYKEDRRYPRAIIIQGMLLVIWLTSQLLINPDFFASHLHVPLFFIGGLLIVLGFSQMKDKGLPPQ